MTDSDKPIEFRFMTRRYRLLAERCAEDAGESSHAYATVGDLRAAGFVPVAELEELSRRHEAMLANARELSRWVLMARVQPELERRWVEIPVVHAEAFLDGTQPPSVSGQATPNEEWRPVIGERVRVGDAVDTVTVKQVSAKHETTYYVVGDPDGNGDCIGAWVGLFQIRRVEQPEASGQAEQDSSQECLELRDSKAKLEAELAWEKGWDLWRKGAAENLVEACRDPGRAGATATIKLALEGWDKANELDTDQRRGRAAEVERIALERWRERAQSAESDLARLRSEVIRFARETTETAPEDAAEWTVGDALKAMAVEIDFEREYKLSAESALAAAREELERLRVGRDRDIAALQGLLAQAERERDAARAELETMRDQLSRWQTFGFAHCGPPITCDDDMLEQLAQQWRDLAAGNRARSESAELIARLEQERETLLGNATAYPLAWTLLTLASAVEHLLQDHDCDHEKHADMKMAADCAKHTAAVCASLRSAAKPSAQEDWSKLESGPFIGPEYSLAKQDSSPSLGAPDAGSDSGDVSPREAEPKNPLASDSPGDGAGDSAKAEGEWKRCRQLALNDAERCILRENHEGSHMVCGRPCPLLGEYCPECGVNGSEPPRGEPQPLPGGRWASPSEAYKRARRALNDAKAHCGYSLSEYRDKTDSVVVACEALLELMVEKGAGR